MEADALATVFMVMDPEAALRVAESGHVPALLVSRDGGGFRLRSSSSWPAQ
jgi:thiamine biosynthesis lipoprotein ApbE